MKLSKIILGLILVSTLSIFAQNLKVGVVDVEKVLTNLKEYQNAQTKINDLLKGWQQDIDNMTMQYQTKMDEYRKQESMMPEDKKATMQKEIIKMEQDIVAYRQQKLAKDGELAKKQEELLTPIKKKISNIIEKVAKEEKITLVLDKTGDAVVLFADANYDITFKVLDKLNKSGN